MINFNFHLHGPTAETLERLSSIMTTQAQLAAQLTALAAQADKAKAEIVGKLAELQAAVEAAGNATPEVEAALAALAVSIQAADDVVPDAPAA